jgi:hypothetical protein
MPSGTNRELEHSCVVRARYMFRLVNWSRGGPCFPVQFGNADGVQNNVSFITLFTVFLSPISLVCLSFCFSIPHPPSFVSFLPLFRLPFLQLVLIIISYSLRLLLSFVLSPLPQTYLFIFSFLIPSHLLLLPVSTAI